MIVAGIDISERRGQTVVLLDSASMSIQVHLVTRPGRSAEVAEIVQLMGTHAVAVVAVDSPLYPSRMLLGDAEMRQRFGVPTRQGMNGPLYANYRVCDYELIRRGMPLYQVAASYDAAAGWMRVGFDLARALIAAGYRLPADHTDHEASLIEVFPDAAFVTLLGARPARKSGPAGARGRAQRRDILAASGIVLEPTCSHDEIDAVAAALTARRWYEGRACALGHAAEGLIVLPVPCTTLRDRYRPLARSGEGAP